jgi:hypothetical protein
VGDGLRRFSMLALICALPLLARTASGEDAVVFHDEFADNAKGWYLRPAEDTARIATIANHRFILECITDAAYVQFMPVRIHEDDWTAELTFTFTRISKEKEGAGITIGAQDTSNLIDFFVDSYGNYSFWTLLNGQWTNVIDWLPTNALRKGLGATNTIAVQKVGDRFFLNVNGQNVDRLKALPLPGRGFGFHLVGRQRMEVSKLHVTESLPAATVTAMKANPKPDVAAPALPEVAKPAEPAKKARTTIVAVFPIEDVSGKLGKTLPTQLADYLGTLLTKKGTYAYIPQEQLKRQLTTTKAQSYSACYDSACQIELGKAASAEAIVNTKIIRVGGTCAITSTLFDLKTESAIKAADAEGKCSEKDLLGAFKSIAEQL